MTDFIGKDIIKIGSIFSNLVVVKILDNGMYECKCLCNNLEVISGEALLKREFEMCSKCNKEIKMKLDNRNRKELYFIWNNFKQLYNKPTKRFREEIIDKSIKFFPTIFDEEDGFERFYNWAIIDGKTKNGASTGIYGDLGKIYLDRENRLLDFDWDNCYWTSSKSDSYYTFPQLNEKRERQNLKTTNSYYDNEDDEKELEDSEIYYGDDSEDIDINSEEFKRDLEEFSKLIANKH